MAFFIYSLASLVLVVAKAAQVHKHLEKGVYSWKAASPLFIAWIILVMPGINANCAQASCQFGVNFGWWMDLVRDMQTIGGSGTGPVPVVIILLVGFIWVHVLGHLFGWIFHGGHRLFQAEA